jgi:dihydroorotate dehydrogenase (NAD+) catalytic subunit
MLDLSIDLNGLKLQNPILTASGTYGYAEEFTDFYDVNQLGGFVTKAITPEKRPGNAIPRVAETEFGMLNSIGLANVGLEEFLKTKAIELKQFDNAVIVNVAGKEISHYVEVAEKLNEIDHIKGIEVNISCPNVKEGGIAFGANPKIAAAVTKEVKKVYDKHIMLKLSPNVTDITVIAKACEDAGADSLSLINTLFGMAIDINTFKPKVKSVVAGYSGPGIKPVALALLYKVANAVKIPLVGMGGITSGKDVMEFMLAGASAVQIGTANFTNPTAALKILKEFKQELEKREITSAKSLIKGMK